MSGSIKTIKDIHVGDTVTLANNPAKEALAGYKTLNPMVYCGIYPVDNAKYKDLKEALEKIVLSDSSLVYEPESSQSLGFGFRCGFLGLLHMDVIQERLEREYDLTLIATAPSVIYKITLTNGNEIKIDNPSLLPDPQKIQSIQEPYVKVTIMTDRKSVV